MPPGCTSGPKFVTLGLPVVFVALSVESPLPDDFESPLSVVFESPCVPVGFSVSAGLSVFLESVLVGASFSVFAALDVFSSGAGQHMGRDGVWAGSLSCRGTNMCLGSPRAFMLSKTLEVAWVTEESATTAASSWDGLMAAGVLASGRAGRRRRAVRGRAMVWSLGTQGVN